MPLQDIGDQKVKGLKKNLHGDVYQLKLLMLYMLRGLKLNYNFWLSTESPVADKFDDVIFEFENAADRQISRRFLQAKHKLNEFETITHSDLLERKNGDFLLKTYFIDYLKIKNKFKDNPQSLKDFIICTNIDFDPDTDKIVYPVEVIDPLMDMSHVTTKSQARFCRIKYNEVIRWNLAECSIAHQLAHKLASSVNNSKKILLSGLVKEYQLALLKEIIDFEKKRLRHVDIESPNGSVFAKIFFPLVKDRNIPLILSQPFGKSSSSRGKKLPSDTVNENDIREFLEKLTFAVNQPNEEELGDIINKEIGDATSINLIKSDFITDSFMKEIFDWFKAKEHNKHTMDSGKKLFDGLVKKLEILLNVNLDSYYTEKLKMHKAKFVSPNSTLQDFFSHPEKTVFNFVTPQPFLGVLEIYNNIEDYCDTYKKRDSKMFVNLDMFVVPDMQKKIIDLFKLKDVYNLLVIDCDCKSGLKIINKLYRILNKGENKKIIFVSSEPIIFFNNTTSVVKLNKSIKFSEFTTEVQNKLMERNICFQGKCMKLKKILSSRSHDYDALLDDRTLYYLFNSETISIGGTVEYLGELKGLYIPRKFRQRVEINQEIFKENFISDFFVITGDEANRFSSRTTKAHIENKINDEFKEKHFQDLCREKKKLGHWLKFENNKLLWQQSSGSVSKLVPYRTEYEIICSEGELLNGPQKFILISDIAGMGKSTILSSLSAKAKEKFGNCWIVRIDLWRYVQVLGKNMDKEFITNDDVINFIYNDIFKLDRSCKIEYNLFRRCFFEESKTPIILFIDGFDEISPNYEKLVVRFIKKVQEMEIKKVIVATRPNMVDNLEKSLGVFSHSLVQFEKAHQKLFLVNFWKSKLTGLEINETRLDIYANHLIETISASIRDREVQFTGIPLQTRMLAEIFTSKSDPDNEWESCEQFMLNTHEKPSLPRQLSLIKLYELFYQKKIDDFKHNKANDQSDNLIKTDGIELIVDQAYHFHQLLSLRLFFKEDQIEELQGTVQELGKMEKLIPKIGFIVRLGDETKLPEFAHRTYAEYFAAKFFINRLYATKRNPQVMHVLFGDVLLKKEFEVVRIFLNNYLFPKLQINYLEEYHTTDIHLNESKQTCLHVAAEEGNINLIRFILNSTGDNAKQRNHLLTAKNEKEETVLHMAAKSGSLEIMQFLIEMNKENVNAEDTLGRSVLYIAASRGHWDIVEWLTKKDLNVVRHNINTAKTFYFAAIACKEIVLRNLLNNFDFSYIKNSGILFDIIEHGHLDVLKLLAEQYPIWNKSDGFYILLLSASVKYLKTDIIKWIISENPNENSSKMLRHIASEYKQTHILQNLTQTTT